MRPYGTVGIFTGQFLTGDRVGDDVGHGVIPPEIDNTVDFKRHGAAGRVGSEILGITRRGDVARE
jgi:hypothetical protein